jgi:hypothetical protein
MIMARQRGLVLRIAVMKTCALSDAKQIARQFVQLTRVGANRLHVQDEEKLRLTWE